MFRLSTRMKLNQMHLRSHVMVDDFGSSYFVIKLLDRISCVNSVSRPNQNTMKSSQNSGQPVVFVYYTSAFEVHKRKNILSEKTKKSYLSKGKTNYFLMLVQTISESSEMLSSFFNLRIKTMETRTCFT